jgi:DNA polymerase-3 subunit epsilon
MREIALDTETTGLDPKVGHKIVEIGCVEMINRVRTGKHYHVYLNPERDMPEEAYNVHGLSSEFLADKPLFMNVAEEFLAFIGESPLIIHNAAFDMKFINHELKYTPFAQISMEQTVDTVMMARRKFPGSPASLDALCKRFEIDLGKRTKHGALLDAELLADVYLELTGGRQSGLELEQEKVKQEEELEEQDIQDIPKRNFPPSEKELEEHKHFINQIKNALWEQTG